ncbi:hypothetical protein BDN72DRAFT_780216 [Pluteus cervinus]|uniref:Uncharacterized protein n=1 Tax=Pluteus cervinus TaxID=181527 RepID=A0ACD3A2A9_9AGAR|nr:hypothetical protein BDN72DRAFT_780216 [Pluteus cervinus]
MFRQNLAQLISPMRRIRPRVPFWELRAHRVPTLWSLYRGLLREAPTEQIRFRVRMLFRKYRHLTGTGATKTQLLKGYKWLDTFTQANNGNKRCQDILLRYSGLISVRCEKERWRQLIREEVLWRTKLRWRPIMTGGYLRASIFNKPLPRLRPQPVHISMMISKRRWAKERQAGRLAQLHEDITLINSEMEFEKGLKQMAGGKFQSPFFGEETKHEWMRPIKAVQTQIYNSFHAGVDRATTPYPPELLAAIKEARKEKIANKTRERERERKGEVLPRTIERMNQGPPAHVLATMSTEKRVMDKVVRSVGEVGYVAKVKKRLGFKLREPEKWKVEGGWELNKLALDKAARDISLQNKGRRRHDRDVHDEQPLP